MFEMRDIQVQSEQHIVSVRESPINTYESVLIYTCVAHTCINTNTQKEKKGSN